MSRKQPKRRLFAALLAGALALGGVAVAGAAVTAQAEPEGLTNFALDAEVSVSGTEIDPETNQVTAWTPDRAVDGKVGLVTDEAWQEQDWLMQVANHKNTSASRWSANNEDGAWLALDLGSVVDIDHVTVVWGKQYGNPYRIETSTDGSEWRDVSGNLTGADSATIETELEGIETRYIRLYVTQRSGQYAASIWEFEVWGTEKVAEPENLSVLDTTKVLSSGQEVDGQWGPELAIDGLVGLVGGENNDDFSWRDNGENFRNAQASRWSANKEGEWYLGVDLGATANIDHVSIVWGKQFGKSYTIQTSNDGSDWTDVVTKTQAAASQETTDELTDVSARYVRVKINERNDVWSTGIWEFEVWGTWTNGAPEPEPEPVDDELPSVVPEPVTYTAVDDEGFVLSPESDIVYQGEGAQAEAEKLAETLRVSTGYDLEVVAESNDGVPDIEIVIGTDEQLEDYVGTNTAEGYLLVSDVRMLGVAAATTDGLYNGIQTIYQLLGPFSVADFTTNGPWEVPALEITDHPRYEWRAIMLDPARSFLTVDEIKQAIDVLSMYKLNVLHLHLTDDQGWRVEITNEGRDPEDTIDYTRLAEIAGDAAMGTTQYQQNPGIRGYYTQDDLREIVAYANAHHIEVVPEIDMPGHSQGILHAIPQLNSAESSHDGTVDPKTGEKIENPAEWICAPAQTTGDVGGSYLDYNNEYTWMFLEHVVKQITDICGSGYIHIGGDETHQLNTDYPGRAVQFLNKAGEMVREMGLTPIGWNEWASSGVDLESGDTIQCWNGQPSAGTITSSDARIIWSMAQNAYFPQRPGTNVAGPSWAGGADGVCNIDDFYNYDPSARAGLSDEYVRGVEGAMWSEHVRGIQDFFFPSFPRAMALAEVGWTPQDARTGQVADLRERLADTVPALTMKGADFYAEDGLENEPLVAATDLVTAPSVGVAHTIAHGYMPMTDIADVTATITWEDDTTQQLGVVQNRPYQAPTAANNNNRAQNGLWELTLTELPGQGTHTGTVTFTAGGKTVTDTVTVTVTGGETIYGNNIALSAASGEQGEKVTVTLSDFAPSASVSLSFGDSTLGSVTVNEFGVGTYEFTVPAVKPGTYQVTTDPVGSGAEFEVTPAFSPVVTLYPATAAPGFEVSVTVTGLEPEKDATLTSEFGDVTLTVDADGAAEATISVPEDATTGSYEVTVEQGWWSGSATLTIASDALAHPIDQELYEIAGFSSQETTGETAPSGPANAAIDGDPSTYWHSAWQSGTSSLPGYITIDLGAEYDVDGVSYLPRQSTANGLMKDYKVFVTADKPSSVPDGTPAAEGTFPNVTSAGSRDATIVNFDEPVTGRYVTIVATSTHAGNNYVGAAELVVSGLEHTDPEPEPEPTPVDKTALQDALDAAEAVDRTNKTEDSLATLDEAVTAGKVVMDNDEATEAEVAEAAQAILDAIVGLETVEPEPEPEPTLDSIAVKTLPAKTSYVVGDELQPSGLELTLTYSDDSTKTVAYVGAADEFAFSPTTFSAAGTVEVTVTYAGMTATFEVTVSEPEPTPDPVEEARKNLQEVIENNGALAEDDYTPESWAAYAEALANAQAALDDDAAAADELNTAADELLAAVAGLKDAEPDPGTDPDPDEPGTDPDPDEPGTNPDDQKPIDDQKPSDDQRPGNSQQPATGDKDVVPATNDPSYGVALLASMGAALSGVGAVLVTRRRQ